MLNIALNNGATTPVSKTFAFAMQDGTLYQYQDMSAGTYEGFNILTINIRPSGAKNMGHKVVLTLKCPTLAVTAPSSGTGVQPNPVAAYVTMAKIEFMIPKAASLDARKDVFAFAKNLLAKTEIQALVHDLTSPQ